MTKFEEELIDLINKHKASGEDLDEIASALEIQLSAVQEEIATDPGEDEEDIFADDADEDEEDL